MLTIIETPHFAKLKRIYWDEEEFEAFTWYIASNAAQGAVVPNSGGVRKIRWTRHGRGKSAGVRVIYYVRTTQGELVLLLIYAKSQTENIPAHILKEIKNAIENAESRKK